ncbi:hypothetical protein P7K49_002035 [Saguinus oedipus]|uniref:Uncharacterized protein n=1 Tax=Saguinus oedipus TaxID=9490 RepID=A0ABQ9WG95_SAGOE|nr:hypothetical protein P7K49_002035 [Saguinus oedipus]
MHRRPYGCCELCGTRVRTWESGGLDLPRVDRWAAGCADGYLKPGPDCTPTPSHQSHEEASQKRHCSPEARIRVLWSQVGWGGAAPLPGEGLWRSEKAKRGRESVRGKEELGWAQLVLTRTPEPCLEDSWGDLPALTLEVPPTYAPPTAGR